MKWIGDSSIFSTSLSREKSVWNRSAMEVNNTPQQSQFHHDLGKNNSGQDFGYPEEELFYTIGPCAANICLSLTTVIGNVLVLITIWKTSSLHSAANILLANLAVSDLTPALHSSFAYTNIQPNFVSRALGSL